jgi:hypothetical protein
MTQSEVAIGGPLEKQSGTSETPGESTTIFKFFSSPTLLLDSLSTFFLVTDLLD